jgi:molybdopterin-containing oxidoreductase family iron-sulfur binding subunit
MPELDRRDFLKLVGVGAGAAAAAGCSDPVEKLIPYVIQPEEITPGIPVFYASTCRECPAGCGLHVKTREGRPVKLEGNPEHPVNRGRLCARGQVGIGRTYHPDRFSSPMRRGAGGALEAVAWNEALALVAEKIRANPGGTYVLGGDVGPTANRVIDRWVDAVGAGGRVIYEPFAPEALREACRLLYGSPRLPRFDLSRADLVIDFGAESLDSGLSPTEHAAQLAEARDVSRPHGGARFVYVGPRLSLTAGNSDEWLPARPGSEGIVAMAVARVALETRGGGEGTLAGLVREFTPEHAASRAGVDPEAIVRLGRAVARADTAVALPPGVGATSRRAVASTAAVMLLNHVAGSVGRAVVLEAEPEGRARASHREALRLVEAMASGKVSVLIVHDADPVYSLPAAAGFAEALGKVGFVVSTAPMIDETAARAHLVLPDHAPLESWGDAEPRAGVRSLIQPTLRPLLDTRALVDTLLDVGRALGPEVAARLPEGSFRGLVEAAWSGGGADFRKALARGGEFAAPSAGGAPGLAGGVSQLEVAEPLLEGDGELALLAYPHPFLYDGRGANLPWLQEIPDPVTKVAWQSWAELSKATAARLGVEPGDVVAVETPAGRIELSALPRGGLRDDVVAIAIGQGHLHGHYASLAGDGQPGEARGVSVISVLPSITDEAGGRAWLTAKANVSKTGRFHRLALVQFSDNKRGRKLGEMVPLAALAAHGNGGAHADAEHGGGPHEIEAPYDPTKDSTPQSPYRWGMSIDLDRCTGCSACVAACYIENAVPVVGEPYMGRARSMSWLRIERWIGDGEPTLDDATERRLHPYRESLGDVDVRHSPMLCQQCGAAPCESVCPVLATYHNPEGLNGMVYNRCVGTRYCSNNCPYKVRRFNYFDYSRENWPGLLGLMLNPDVTVRGQGVMEKCTFCVQRIEGARQKAKDEGRPIRDGEVRTACQQACPTEAIRFGNLKDAESVVSKTSADPARGYHALHVLNTRPAITYLAKVRRGPVEG